MVLLEGLRFAWALRKASHSYLQWRLGTVYGIFECGTGQPRPLRALLRDLWKDRANVVRFLRWRRQMRLVADTNRRTK